MSDPHNPIKYKCRCKLQIVVLPANLSKQVESQKSAHYVVMMCLSNVLVKFNVSQEEVQLVGTPMTDLGGPKRQLFSQFLQQMPTKLHLVEENSGVLFFTINT